MTVGKLYDCSKEGEFFHTFDNLNVGIMLLHTHFTVILKLDDKDATQGVIQNNPFLIGDGCEKISSPDFVISAPVEEPKNAPTYTHQNATRKARESSKDSEATKELRKYRYIPEDDYNG